MREGEGCRSRGGERGILSTPGAGSLGASLLCAIIGYVGSAGREPFVATLFASTVGRMIFECMTVL